MILPKVRDPAIRRFTWAGA